MKDFVYRTEASCCLSWRELKYFLLDKSSVFFSPRSKKYFCSKKLLGYGTIEKRDLTIYQTENTRNIYIYSFKNQCIFYP
jgi:hypothetical protein